MGQIVCLISSMIRLNIVEFMRRLYPSESELLS